MLPTLTLQPHAGNSFTATVGNGESTTQPIEGVPVNEQPVSVKDFFQTLSKYTSGDFEGESALAKPDRPTVSEREFVIGFDSVGSIHVHLLQPSDALLGIHVSHSTDISPTPGQSQTRLSMCLRLNASNLITAYFEKHTLIVPSLGRILGAEG